MKDNMRGNSSHWDDLDKANNEVQELQSKIEKLETFINDLQESCKELLTIIDHHGNPTIWSHASALAKANRLVCVILEETK
jgi:uncharacterized protein YlxW (UPF0749 family)